MTKFTFSLKMIYYSIKLFFYKKKLLFIVSFPRSAQGVISSVLLKYAEKFNIELKYCEFYQCCNTVPCANGSNIIKNHDYNQKLILSYLHLKILLLFFYMLPFFVFFQNNSLVLKLNQQAQS